MNVSGGDVAPSIEDLVEQFSVCYVRLAPEELKMKKTIVVWGLPGPQSTSVCMALLGNPQFHIRGVFSKDISSIPKFQEKGVETEILEISDKGPISIVKLKHIFRDAYGAFIVSNDSDPPLNMRREMETGLKLAEVCQRMAIKHVIYSTVDYVYRITGQRCSRYDGKGEIEYGMKSMQLPLTVLKLPLSLDYLLATFQPAKHGRDRVFYNTVEPDLEFDVMKYSDVGAVVKQVFERPNVFIGKTLGLTAGRITLNDFVGAYSDMIVDSLPGNAEVCYEKLTLRELQKDKKNNRELPAILEFHCNYAPLRDIRTSLALNPSLTNFKDFMNSSSERIKTSMG